MPVCPCDVLRAQFASFFVTLCGHCHHCLFARYIQFHVLHCLSFGSQWRWVKNFNLFKLRLRFHHGRVYAAHPSISNLRSHVRGSQQRSRIIVAQSLLSACVPSRTLCGTFLNQWVLLIDWPVWIEATTELEIAITFRDRVLATLRLCLIDVESSKGLF